MPRPVPYLTYSGLCALALVAPLAGTDALAEMGPPHIQPTRQRPHSYDRWENGLDVKLTNLYERKATDVTAPTVLLGAQWNYRFVTDTFIGLAGGGVPQSMAFKVDDVKTSFTTYLLGFNIAQGIIDARPLRLVASLGVGEGFLYVRTQKQGEQTKMTGARYRFVEPGIFGTFYDYKGLEIGAVVSYRMARLHGKVEKDGREIATNDDLSAPAFGMTFRTQRH